MKRVLCYFGRHDLKTDPWSFREGSFRTLYCTRFCGHTQPRIVR